MLHNMLQALLSTSKSSEYKRFGVFFNVGKCSKVLQSFDQKVWGITAQGVIWKANQMSGLNFDFLSKWGVGELSEEGAVGLGDQAGMEQC